MLCARSPCIGLVRLGDRPCMARLPASAACRSRHAAASRIPAALVGVRAASLALAAAAVAPSAAPSAPPPPSLVASPPDSPAASARRRRSGLGPSAAAPSAGVSPSAAERRPRRARRRCCGLALRASHARGPRRRGARAAGAAASLATVAVALGRCSLRRPGRLAARAPPSASACLGALLDLRLPRPPRSRLRPPPRRRRGATLAGCTAIRLGLLDAVHLLALLDHVGYLAADGRVGIDRDGDLEAFLERAQMRALVVEQIERDLGAGAHDEIVGRALEQHLLDRAQKLQRDRGDRAHMAGAAAMRAFLGRAFQHARADALARHFQQAEMRDVPDLDARAVVLERIPSSRRSTVRLLRFSSMSMKSMTIRPARSRKRSCRAISSAASRLVLSAVSSM